MTLGDNNSAALDETQCYHKRRMRDEDIKEGRKEGRKEGVQCKSALLRITPPACGLARFLSSSFLLVGVECLGNHRRPRALRRAKSRAKRGRPTTPGEGARFYGTSNDNEMLQICTFKLR